MSNTSNYSYDADHPFNFVDPTGLIGWDSIPGAILGGAGAALGNKIANEPISATDVAIGAAIGFVNPTAGPLASTVYGYLSHLANPPQTSTLADQLPLPADLQALVDRNGIGSLAPQINPYPPLPYIEYGL